MKTVIAFSVAAALLASGCGAGEQEAAQAPAAPVGTPAPVATPEPTATPAAKRRGTEISLAESRFGNILFDARKQAIYVFELDRQNETVCYDECAEAWPPVYTEGAPLAGDGIDEELLGTIERRDGREQVTYDGRPLYYYAHEGPEEVKCHNVDLNGGLWWVVGRDGKPLS